MPWRTESVMDQRVEFVIRARRKTETLAALCREYEISRPTGYLWLQRYKAAGVAALSDRSHAPQHFPSRVSAEIEAAVLALRDEKCWGGPKIAKVLEGRGLRVAPATAQRILKRAGRVPQPQPGKTKVRFARAQCNELAQMDFKGEYQLGRQKC